MNSGRVIGPGVAAGLIALVGTAACFYTNAASYVAVIVALALMRRSELLPLQIVQRQPGQLRLGLKYVFETPQLRNVIIAVAVVGTFAFNFTVTLPLLAHVTFHQKSAAQYGILMGCMGIGAVLGGLLVAHRSRPTPKLLALLAVAFGLFMTLVAFAPTILWAEIALVPTGACSIAFVSSANSTLQLNSGQQMRGRVMSLYSTAFLGTTPFGAPLVGVLIAATNPRIGIFLGAFLTLLTGLWLVFVLRQDHRSSLALQTA
jgi:predicted MFS family arabinose efflux permease